MSSTEDQDRCSGTLEFTSGALEYSDSGRAIWRTPVQHLAVVGEFTTPSLGDDYFLVFVTPSARCFQASFYAVGRDAALSSLSVVLGASLQPGLCNSTELRSRVMWPPSLLGQPLLEPSEPARRRFAGRVSALLGLGQSPVPLSPAVLSYVRGLGPLHAA